MLCFLAKYVTCRPIRNKLASTKRLTSSVYFMQKLYRFINCVELVSPHHAARELVHTLRQGQITSLFQKSVRRVSIALYAKCHKFQIQFIER